MCECGGCERVELGWTETGEEERERTLEDASIEPGTHTFFTHSLFDDHTHTPHGCPSETGMPAGAGGIERQQGGRVITASKDS